MESAVPANDQPPPGKPAETVVTEAELEAILSVDPIIAKYKLQREQLDKDLKNTGAELMKLYANMAYWKGKRHRSKKAIKALAKKEQVRRMTLHKKLYIRKMTQLVRTSPRALGMA